MKGIKEQMREMEEWQNIKAGLSRTEMSGKMTEMTEGMTRMGIDFGNIIEANRKKIAELHEEVSQIIVDRGI